MLFENVQGAQSASSVHRRNVLKCVAMLGAGALVSGKLPARSRPAAAGYIDVHIHFAPPEYVKEASDALRAAGALKFLADWSAEATLEQMDKNEIATGMLSISAPGIWFGNDQQARTLSRTCNEFGASVVRAHPGRFGLFAALPLPDVDGSLREIEYALGSLHADGIGLLTSYGQRWLGDLQFAPVLEELNRRNAVVYVHPASIACCDSFPIIRGLVEMPHDTTRTVMTLLFSHTFAKLPNIRFIFSHAGGSVPMLAGRVEQLTKRLELSATFPQGVLHDLLRQYYDIANSASSPTMAALRAFAPTKQILFGTDWPYVSPEVTAAGLEKLGLSASDFKAIARGNALTLFPRLGT